MATEGSTKKHIKIWKATPSSNPGFMVTERAVFMGGSKNNFIAADDNGVSIVGKTISLTTASENIRHAGLWVLMNDFVRMIPSTIVTPFGFLFKST